MLQSCKLESGNVFTQTFQYPLHTTVPFGQKCKVTQKETVKRVETESTASMSDSDEEELDKETVGRKVNLNKFWEVFNKVLFRQLKSFPQKS